MQVQTRRLMLPTPSKLLPTSQLWLAQISWVAASCRTNASCCQSSSRKYGFGRQLKKALYEQGLPQSELHELRSRLASSRLLVNLWRDNSSLAPYRVLLRRCDIP